MPPTPRATKSASCDSIRRSCRSSPGPSRFATWKSRATSCGRRLSPRADRKDHAGTRGGRDGDTSSSTAQTRSTVRSNEAGPPSVARGTQQGGRREVGHGTGGGWELWLRVVCHTGRQKIKQTRLGRGVGTSRRVGRGTGRDWMDAGVGPAWSDRVGPGVGRGKLVFPQKKFGGMSHSSPRFDFFKRRLQMEDDPSVDARMTSGQVRLDRFGR